MVLFSFFLLLQLPADAFLSHVLEAPGIHEWFEGATDAGNPDALLLALKISEKVSDDIMVFGKLLPSPFNSSKFFSTDHLSSIDNCLKVTFKFVHTFAWIIMEEEAFKNF